MDLLKQKLKAMSVGDAYLEKVNFYFLIWIFKHKNTKTVYKSKNLFYMLVNLKCAVKSLEVTNTNVMDVFYPQIMTEVKSGRFNVACTRYFEATHKLPVEYQAQAFSHPNQYFDESQRNLNGDNKGGLQLVWLQVVLSCSSVASHITTYMYS